jgi:two-component system response regulator MprA
MTKKAKHNKCGTILVVDDEPQIRESLRKVLRAEGHEVVLAANDAEARHEFNTHKIDLVLLDLSMPGDGGWDTFGWLTAAVPTLPIVIITGRPNQSEFVFEAGVSALIEKPFNLPFLLKTIVELLAENPRARLERLIGQRRDLRFGQAIKVPATIHTLAQFFEATIKSPGLKPATEKS